MPGFTSVFSMILIVKNHRQKLFPSSRFSPDAYVKPSEHIIEMRYRADSFVAGAAEPAIGLVGLLVLGLLTR